MWVHRLSVDDSGSPRGSIKMAEVKDQLFDVAKEVMVGRREQLRPQTAEARAFLLSELFDRGVLRQGWGAPGMSVQSRDKFLRNHVIAMWRYWEAIPARLSDDVKKADRSDQLFSLLQPYYEEAAGRLAIIIRMMKMKYGDIVFLPNVPEPGNSFAVARINDRRYQFEDPARGDGTAVWHFDFGHKRTVTDVRRFRYGPETLQRAAFSAPYLHAIDPVGARADEFQAFVGRHYVPT